MNENMQTDSTSTSRSNRVLVYVTNLIAVGAITFFAGILTEKVADNADAQTKASEVAIAQAKKDDVTNASKEAAAAVIAKALLDAISTKSPTPTPTPALMPSP